VRALGSAARIEDSVAVPPPEADGWRLGATEPTVAAVTRWMVGQGDEDVPRGNSTCATVFVRG